LPARPPPWPLSLFVPENNRKRRRAWKGLREEEEAELAKDKEEEEKFLSLSVDGYALVEGVPVLAVRFENEAQG